jgi:amino acid transporter
MGPVPAVVAGAALMIDYVLTVAVSVAAGIAAIVSAAPWLGAHRLALALLTVLALTLANLRGVRESATIFSVPTYAFLASMAGLLAVGAWRVATGQAPLAPVAAAPQPPLETLSLLLVLRASPPAVRP